ncbi:MAG: PEP-CTERM sorting domain-containing protein, partial [Planctomycetota bacterium]
RNPDPSPEDWFGSSLALDGANAIIASRFDASEDGSIGKVYHFIPEPASIGLIAIAVAGWAASRRVVV